MTRLFNKGGDGAGEIVRVLGLIDNDLDFTKWEPILLICMMQRQKYPLSDVFSR